MKKIISLIAVALSIVAFASCQKEISADNSKQDLGKESEIYFILKTGESTKSYMEYDSSAKTYTAKWKNGDVIGMIFGDEASGAAIAKTLSNTAADGTTATFEGSVTASTSGSFQAVSPSLSVEKFYTQESEQCVLGFNVGDKNNNYKQHPTKGSFDSTCDLLISKSCTYSADELGTVTIGDLQFTRLLAILKVNLTGSYAAGEKINDIKVEGPGSIVLSGRAKVTPSTYTINDWTVKKNYAWAVYTDSDQMPAINSDAVYLVVNPETIDSGSTLTLTAETEANYISKTITLTKDFALTAGKVTVLNIGITSTECTSKSTPKTLPYEESFDGTFGSFSVENKILPTELTTVWSANSGYAKATGYASSTPYASEALLVSPKINTTGAAGVMLSFSHALNYLYGGTASDHIHLYVREYTGDSAGEWQDVAINTYPSGSSWTFVTNTANLYTYTGKTIQIAFRYTSTSAYAPTWEVKNVSVAVPVTAIEFANSSVTMKVGDAPVSNPATSNSPATVTYESSNVSVATVDESGNISAVANGTCTITASVVASQGFPAASTTCNVTVASSTTATLQLSSSNKFGNNATSKTDDKSNVWTYVSSGSTAGGNYQSSYSGQQFGTGSTNYYFTFTTPVPSGKTVKSVTITAAAGNTTPTYDISVGGSSWKSGSLSKNSTDYSGTGSCNSGNIVITLNQNSGNKAVYLGKIVIVYE